MSIFSSPDARIYILEGGPTERKVHAYSEDVFDRVDNVLPASGPAARPTKPDTARSGHPRTEPMSLIKLSDGHYVAADQIAELKVPEFKFEVRVHMKDGSIHTHAPGYNEGAYAALDRLVAQINEKDTTE